MQVGPCEVDNLPATRVLDPGIADVPFLWNGPIEHGRSRRDLMNAQRNFPLQDGQSAAHTIPRDAAADRIEFGRQFKHLPAGALTGIHGETKSGYVRSRSQITQTSSGHSMWKLGSFHRNPRAESGA